VVEEYVIVLVFSICCMCVTSIEISRNWMGPVPLLKDEAHNGEKNREGYIHLGGTEHHQAFA